MPFLVGSAKTMPCGPETRGQRSLNGCNLIGADGQRGALLLADLNASGYLAWTAKARLNLIIQVRISAYVAVIMYNLK